MIITTRYRDIPFEEVMKCQRIDGDPQCEKFWNEVRGKEVQIHSGIFEFTDPRVVCSGPFYRRVVSDGSAGIVCPHIAEIGD